MLIAWWILFSANVAIMASWIWIDIAALQNDYPWYDIGFAALCLIGVVRLYPLARKYDAMGRR